MKKKILTLTLCVAMLATVAISGTLAYFTDAEQKTNVMTIGNVDINLEENVKVKDANGVYVYEKFEDEKFTLYPVSNDTVYEDLNAHYNKVVRTFNTSTSEDDAYIRTIILFEKNDNLEDSYTNDGDCCLPGLHFGYYDSKDTSTTVDGKTSHGSTNVVFENAVTIGTGDDAEEYWVVVFTSANETAIPYGEALHTLNIVWMDKNIESDQIDGWGEDVDIIVLTQGIQSYDLTHAEAMEALGEVNETNLNMWLTGEEKAADAVINDVAGVAGTPTNP